LTTLLHIKKYFEDEVAIFLQFAYVTYCFQNNQNYNKLKKMFLYFAADTYHLLSDVFLGSITISTKKKPKQKSNQKQKQSKGEDKYTL